MNAWRVAAAALRLASAGTSAAVALRDGSLWWAAVAAAMFALFVLDDLPRMRRRS